MFRNRTFCVSVGENGVWGGITLYLQHGDILSWGKEVGGHSVITFRQKLRPKLSHHDDFYNGARLAQTLLDRQVRVCGTMMANRDIPHDLYGEGKWLKKGKSAFQRKGDKMVQVWKDQRLVRMIKYDPLGNNCKHKAERQENKYGNKEALLMSSTINSWRAQTGQTSTSGFTQFWGTL
jgi:hypothetical protein